MAECSIGWGAHAFRLVLYAGAVLMIAGCSDDGNSSSDDEVVDAVVVALEDFPDVVEAGAGPDSENCGTVRTGESAVEANTCLAQAFSSAADGWAVFDFAPSALQDSPALLGAVHGTVTVNGGVEFYSFDERNPSSTSTRSSITVVRCLEPTLSGTVDESGPFACGSLRTISASGQEGDAVAAATLVEATAWVWDGYRRGGNERIEPLPEDLFYSIGFAANGSYRGLANCIGYRGAWSSRGAIIDIEAGLKDGLDCEDVQTTGAIYFEALERESRFTVMGGQLILFPVNENGTTLIFSEGNVLYPDQR